MTFQINSVAIIGAGPSGIAALHEFLKTSKQGESFVGTKKSPADKLFDKIVVFEQNQDVGGVWNTKITKPDPIFAPEDSLKQETYYEATQLLKPASIHAPTLDKLENTSVDSTIIVPHDVDHLSWGGSALYKGLFTNIPERYTRFSTASRDEKSSQRLIHPFITAEEFDNRIKTFAHDQNLYSYIRFGTLVQRVKKSSCGHKWKVYLKKYNQVKQTDEWYSETFDAVVVANGHFSIPFIPLIKGLGQFTLTRDPTTVIHAKSFRDPDQFKDKNVLVVGSAISGIGIVQHLYPIVKNLIISRRPEKIEKTPWLNEAIESLSSIVKPTISSIDPETGKVYFDDDTFVENIDHVIFATGYHWSVPFFDKNDNYISHSIPPNKVAPANNSRIKNIYYGVFHIEDPTLAFVGLLQGRFLTFGFESALAAIAGVWLNYKKLPSKEQQYEWQDQRVKAVGDTNAAFAYDSQSLITNYIGRLLELAPKGRPSPIDEQIPHLKEIESGENNLEQLFYKFKAGELKFEDIFSEEKLVKAKL